MRLPKKQNMFSVSNKDTVDTSSHENKVFRPFYHKNIFDKK